MKTNKKKRSPNKKKASWQQVGAAIVVTLLLVGGLALFSFFSRQASQTQANAATLISENFEGYPIENWAESSIHSPWNVQFTGFGTAGIEMDQSNKVLYEKPQASTSLSETHASLVTTEQSYGDIDLSLRASTVQQLRTPTPNAWETAWVMWHYTDNTHFYYLAMKTNGWELGKGDPAYGGAQRFLATGSTPSFSVGTWYTVRVTQQGNVMSVWVNGQLLTSFTDTERPYLSGAVGLYNEDSYVYFDDISITDFATPTITPTSTPLVTPTSTPTISPTITPVLDAIAPTVTLTNPLNGSTVTRNTTVTIKANATDNIRVSKVVFSVNNSIKCTDTIAPYTCNWKVPSARNTTYTIQAKAYDAANNISTHSISVTSSR